MALRRYEACRIRLVSQPDYADSLMGVAKRMSGEMGFVGAFYSGFVPILFKQVSRLPPACLLVNITPWCRAQASPASAAKRWLS